MCLLNIFGKSKQNKQKPKLNNLKGQTKSEDKRDRETNSQLRSSYAVLIELVMSNVILCCIIFIDLFSK